MSIVKLRDLSLRQKNKLIEMLEEIGFEVTFRGHVDLKKPKEGHPRYLGGNKKVYLPVAFIKDNRIELVNTDKKFPEDYHRQIREIRESL